MERSCNGSLGAHVKARGAWRYHLALRHEIIRPASVPTTAQSAKNMRSAAIMPTAQPPCAQHGELWRGL